MCDISQRLIAWLDHELSATESADVERHLQCCVECRNRLASYKRVTHAFDEYCEATVTAKMPDKLPSWAPGLAAAAAAIAIAVFLIFPRARVQPPLLHPSAENSPPAIVLSAVAPVRSAPRFAKFHLRQAAAPVQLQSVNWMPDEPAVQITFPAETMFAPGAIPEGVSFIADLSIGADGSAERLRLRP
jgi:anti-sigma factor RsiW